MDLVDFGCVAFSVESVIETIALGLGGSREFTLTLYAPRCIVRKLC